MDRTRLTRKTPMEGAFAAFGGFDFQLQGDPGACARLLRVAGSAIPSGGARAADTPAPKFAASCRLKMLPAPGHERRPVVPRPGISWRWGEGGGELVTRLGAAQVEGAAKNFAADGWIDDHLAAPHFLLSGLTAMLAHRLGGGILHAASVVLDGQAIAFIGPSGAGKSTACQHVDGAPLFAVDRLAIAPFLPSLSPIHGPRASHSGSLAPGAGSGDPVWFAHPLPGGTRPVPDMPSASPCWLPLGGVLRIERASRDTAIVRPSLAGAVTSLRQSTLMAGLGPHVEHELLATLEDLARRLPVARLQLSLGASLAPLLRRWLVDPGKDRG